MVPDFAATFIPGRTRSSPLITTLSPGFSPVCTTDENELSILVGSDCLILHHGRRAVLIGGKSHASEQPWSELMIRVAQDGADTNRSGGPVDAVVDEVDLGVARKPSFIGEANLDRT